MEGMTIMPANEDVVEDDVTTVLITIDLVCSEQETLLTPSATFNSTVEKVQSTREEENVFQADSNIIIEATPLYDLQTETVPNPDGSMTLFTCDKCYQTFVSKEILEDHLKSHAQEKPHICQICNELLTTSGSLSKHMQNHSGGMAKHLPIPTGNKPTYTCNVCDKSFDLRKSLQKHKLLHTGEKQWTCNLCPKLFSSLANLRMHGYTHSNTSFICKVCNRAYKYPGSLRRHRIKESHFLTKAVPEVTRAGRSAFCHILPKSEPVVC